MFQTFFLALINSILPLIIQFILSFFTGLTGGTTAG